MQPYKDCGSVIGTLVLNGTMCEIRVLCAMHTCPLGVAEASLSEMSVLGIP